MTAAPKLTDEDIEALRTFADDQWKSTHRKFPAGSTRNRLRKAGFLESYAPSTCNGLGIRWRATPAAFEFLKQKDAEHGAD